MNTNNPLERSDPIDLRIIFDILWKRKLVIFVATTLIGLFSVFYALSIPNIYESKVVLAPSTSSETTNINISGTAGALARVAGIDLGGGSDKGPNMNLAVEKITSRQFVIDFITDNNFQPELIASEGWDSGKNKIIYSNKGYSTQKDELTYKPRDIDIYKGYMDRIGVFFDKRTKFTHVSFKHHSPFFAKELLDELVLTINNDIKDIDVKVANESIRFLEDQIAKTNVSDLKLIFSKLIEKNIKTVLLAEVNPEFVFTVVDPAFVPDLKTAPSRGLMCILITIFGFLFIVTFFAIFDYLKLNNQK